MQRVWVGAAPRHRTRSDQGAINVDHDPSHGADRQPRPACVRRLARHAPSQPLAQAPQQGTRSALLTFGSDATRPNNSGYARTTAKATRPSPQPARGRHLISSSVLPGCTSNGSPWGLALWRRARVQKPLRLRQDRWSHRPLPHARPHPRRTTHAIREAADAAESTTVKTPH